MAKSNDPADAELFIGTEIPTAEKSSSADARGEKRSPTERTALIVFVRRMVLFWLPVILFIATVEGLLWRIGETWPLESVIRGQDANPRAIFLRGLLDESTFRYKYLGVLHRRPRILALGSSRVMQIRAEMFGRQAPVFYNGGGLIRTVDDLNDLLARLPADALPQTIILAVDFWLLNAAEKPYLDRTFAHDVDEDGARDWQGHALAISKYVRNPGQIAEMWSYAFGAKRDSNAIGMEAAVHHRGFRPDGSKRFDLKIPASAEAWGKRRPGLDEARRRIANGGRDFAFTDGVSAPLRDALRTALLKWQARGVFVIAYSPPVMSECARLAVNHPAHRRYWQEYHEQVPLLFQSLGIPFLDVTEPADLGLDDRYMRDVFHAHETFNLHLLSRLCTDPRVRAMLPDVPNVVQQALGSRRTNPFYLDLPGSNEPPAGASRTRKHGKR
jgi:hypothetical protein